MIPPDETQAGLDLGRANRDRGMESVTTNTGAAWRLHTQETIAQFARTGRQFNFDEIIDIVGEPPHHPNAIGPQIAFAVRRGIIVECGYRQATRAAGHARNAKLYIGAGFVKKEAKTHYTLTILKSPKNGDIPHLEAFVLPDAKASIPTAVFIAQQKTNIPTKEFRRTLLLVGSFEKDTPTQKVLIQLILATEVNP